MIVEPSLDDSRPSPPVVLKTGQVRRWWGALRFAPPSRHRLGQIAFSMADQGLSVGGMFLANIALARVQSKEEYGMFALSYSIFTFLGGLHNAVLLETYTIYGSGRYHRHFPEYAGLMWRSNAVLGLILTAVLLLIWRAVAWSSPAASGSLLSMALTCGVLLTASFVRRTLYIRRRPDLAAWFSLVFFAVLAVLLWLLTRLGILDGFSTFIIIALAWICAGLFLFRHLPRRNEGQSFIELEPNYWSEHWKYSRWVLVTGLVFQLTTQAFYWLVAGFVSVKDVANLRAMYLLISPIDQVFVAMSLLVLPIMALRYASRQNRELISLWKTYGVANVLITGSFALLVQVIGRPAMHALYGGKFDDVSIILGILAFVPIAMGVGNTANAALKSIEKPNIVFYGYVASGAATFVAGIPLVIHFGLRGAAYGMLISAGVYTVTLWIGLLYLIPNLNETRICPASAD